MFRCKDCGKEYNEQVDYCDCGNNSFEYIEPVQKPVKQTISLEQKSQILSLLFFFVCIIMSVIVWLIPVKTEVAEQKETEKPAITNKNIPNIDKIWDDTPVAVVQKNEEQQPAEEPQLTTLQEKILVKLNTAPEHPKVVPPQPVQKTVTTTAQQKTKPQPAAKPATATKPVVTAKPAQTTQSKPVIQQQKPVVQQSKPQQTTQSKTQPAQQSKPQTSQQSKPQQVTQPVQQPKPVVKTEPAKPVYNPNSPEMLRYKGNLRSAMFAKLPVGSIQGSGSCSVTFSVDSTGKLVNRGFASKSDNKTLNDAVYYMMMSVPRFNPPPSNYNGETIRMNFIFNNGSYEISIY